MGASVMFFFLDGFSLVVEPHDIQEVEVVTDPCHGRWNIPDEDAERLQTFLRESGTTAKSVLGPVLGVEGKSLRDKLVYRNFKLNI